MIDEKTKKMMDLSNNIADEVCSLLNRHKCDDLLALSIFTLIIANIINSSDKSKEDKMSHLDRFYVATKFFLDSIIDRKDKEASNDNP